MGWCFSPRWRTRADMLAYLVSPERWGPKFRILQSSPRGNNHWYAAENIETRTRFIGLDLMRGGTKADPGWGYKDIDETMGPVETNCPVNLFNLVPDPGGHATAWRAKVLERAAAERNRPKPAAGLVVELYGRRFKLAGPAGPRKGWVVAEMLRGSEPDTWEQGPGYRLTAKQIAEAKEIKP